MFEIEDREWSKVMERMKNEMGHNLIETIREELREIKSYYDNSLANQIQWNEEEGGIEVTTIAPIIVNEGLLPGTFPPIDKIREWVKKYDVATPDRNYLEEISYRIKRLISMGDRADEREIDRVAYMVARKIYNKGIEPTWYMDRAITKFDENVREG